MMKAEPYQFLSAGDASLVGINSLEDIDISEVAALLQSSKQANQQIVMRFSEGQVSRECFTPAADRPGQTVFAVSRKHKFDHFWSLDMGCVGIWTQGDGWTVLNAPQKMVTKAGTQRVIAILEDSMVTTYHRNPDNLTDPAELDAYLYEPGLGLNRLET